MLVACREAWRTTRPRAAGTPATEAPVEAVDRRTVLIVPPEVESRLGLGPAPSAPPVADPPQVDRPAASRPGRRAAPETQPDDDRQPARKESVLT